MECFHAFPKCSTFFSIASGYGRTLNIHLTTSIPVSITNYSIDPCLFPKRPKYMQFFSTYHVLGSDIDINTGFRLGTNNCPVVTLVVNSQPCNYLPWRGPLLLRHIPKCIQPNIVIVYSTQCVLAPYWYIFERKFTARGSSLIFHDLDSPLNESHMFSSCGGIYIYHWY